MTNSARACPLVVAAADVAVIVQSITVVKTRRGDGMHEVLVNAFHVDVLSFPYERGKGKGQDTCYSAAYTSQTRDQQRFTISEMTADWHKPMVPQRIM